MLTMEEIAAGHLVATAVVAMVVTAVGHPAQIAVDRLAPTVAEVLTQIAEEAVREEILTDQLLATAMEEARLPRPCL